MKIVVTGGHNYVMAASDYVFLENAVSILGGSAILTGGARGVDTRYPYAGRPGQRLSP